MFLCLKIESVASFGSIPLVILNINDLGTRKRCEWYQKLHCLEINPWYEEVLLKNNVSVTIIKSWNNDNNWHKSCQNINLPFGLLFSMKVIRFHCMCNASYFYYNEFGGPSSIIVTLTSFTNYPPNDTFANNSDMSYLINNCLVHTCLVKKCLNWIFRKERSLQAWFLFLCHTDIMW